MMKKWMTGFLVILGCILLASPMGASAKTITKSNLKKEIAAQRKKVPLLREKVNAAKKTEKKYRKMYMREKGKYSAIILGDIRSSSPLVVSSNYILSPLKGHYLIKGGKSSVLGKWTGEVKLTNSYQWCNGVKCRVVKYTKSGATPSYKKYKNAAKRAEKLKAQLSYAKWRISYLKGLPKSKLRLKNKTLTVSEKKRFSFQWNGHENEEKTKWSVSNSKIVRIAKSSSNAVTLVGKKYGTATLTAVAAVSGKKSTCKIKVYDQVQKVAVTSGDGKKQYANGSSLEMRLGRQLQLKGKCQPGTSRQGVEYKSSNEKIATVNSQGLITAKKIGQTTIKVSDSRGKKTSSIKLSVGNYITQMTPKQKNVSVSLMDNSGDIRGTRFAKEQKKKYQYMQKLNDCNPQGMVRLDFTLRMDQMNRYTNDKLTCTSSNGKVVTPMFVYHTSVNDYDEIDDRNAYDVFFEIDDYENNGYVKGAVYVGLMGNGSTTLTLKSKFGVTCSWNIQVGDNLIAAFVPDSAPKRIEYYDFIPKDMKDGAKSKYQVLQKINEYIDGDIVQVDFGAKMNLSDEMPTDDVLSCTSSDENILKPLYVYHAVENYSEEHYISTLRPGGRLYASINGTGDVTVSITGKSGATCTWELSITSTGEHYAVTVVHMRVGKEGEDAEELKRIITQQKKLGAKVSDNLNSEQYHWNEEGRLEEIHWNGMDLQDDIDVSAFSELKKMECNSNQLNSFVCNGTKLASLDISKNTSLSEIDCSVNQLEEFDFTEDRAIRQMYCAYNQLKSLDLSKNTIMTLLQCNNNQITELELFTDKDSLGGPDMEILYCANNQLTSLDLSLYDQLKVLQCDNNQLANLMLPIISYSRDNLSELYCANNKLENLDLSLYCGLLILECSDNQLTELVLPKKGYYYPESYLQILYCANNKLEKISFSANKYLKEINCSNNCFKSLNFNGLSKLTNLDVSENANLEELSCSGTQLENLDISTAENLTTLDCSNMKLASLDISKNGKLATLNCNSNQLASLDISNNGKLVTLDCSSNQLASLNINNNINLEELDCNSNQLSGLDVSANKELKSLNCSSNHLATLDVSNCRQLEHLSVDKNKELEELKCAGCKLSYLWGISSCENLRVLDCSDSQLESLYISGLEKLEELNCAGNQLTSLDTSDNEKLKILDCADNQLSRLNVSKNENLEKLKCTGNQLTSLDVTACTVLKTLECDETVEVTGFSE